MKKEFYAHYRKSDQKHQLLEDHLLSTAAFSRDYCSISLLKNAAWLAGFYHDIGKGRNAWQEYYRESIEQEQEKHREKMDHSTLGGVAAQKRMPNSLLAEMIETAVYYHHGVEDSVSVKDNVPQVRKRRNKYASGLSKAYSGEGRKVGSNAAEQVEEAMRLLEEYAGDISLEAYWENAKADLDRLKEQIFDLAQRGETKNKYGSKQFFLGMCERMLFSGLMDGDIRDTVDFSNGRKSSAVLNESELQRIWDQGIRNVEKKIESLGTESEINRYRAAISLQCRDAAVWEDKLYRLSVPTGAGKTLSSLRFALHCAKYKKKRHIFYIAPFRSILEQNADVIRSVLEMPDMVLEHHSDVVCEREDQMDQYERLIENWDEVPVIVTTAVQFFNTLFKDKKRNIRRFHSLSNSVIILDEVQAFPIKLIQLFNMAANFLTEICNTTIVLCTATQPLFHSIRENRLLTPVDMVKADAYEEAFRRVEIFDDTERFINGAAEEQITEFILEKEAKHEQVLVIVNTKTCAANLYRMLKGKTRGKLFHLSTQMCAEHRENKLQTIRQELEQEERVVCISTQLVEAGVDFSFRCVIRSLAGLDNLIQAAGRCNRNGKQSIGYVHLISLPSDLEDVSKITDIRKAQDAMRKLLIRYRRNPEAFGLRLDSEKAIQCYYQYYFYDRQDEMKYPAKVSEVSTNLVDLLSANHTFARDVKGVYLKQAFNSAGQTFQVIEEAGGADIVVPYAHAADLLEALKEAEDRQSKKIILRKLQRCTVQLSNTWLQKLGNAVYGIEEGRILVLKEGYYSEDTGVVEHPVEMPFLNF